MDQNEQDTRNYNVVVNHEEQYSIWFSDRELPLGWEIVEIPAEWHKKYLAELPEDQRDQAGNKQECLAYIEEIWTDMRPLSLRKKMEEMQQ